MADWTDGAEYAPLDRPAGFTTPRAVPLSVAENEPHPADGQPQVAPAGFQGDPQAQPLEVLTPQPPPSRDPAQPFDVGDSAAEMSWGAVHSSGPHAWHPTQPLGPMEAIGSPVNPAPTSSFAPPSGSPVSTLPPPSGAPVPAFPPPGAPVGQGWGAPGAWPQQAPQGPRGVAALGPTFWVTAFCFLVGVLWSPGAALMFFIGSLVANTVRTGQQVLRPLVSLCYLGLLVVWLGTSAGFIWFDFDQVARLACGVGLVGLVVGGWLGLRKHP